MERCHLVLALAILVPATAVRATEGCDAFGFHEAVVESETGVELFVRHGGSGDPAVVVPGDFLLFDHLCSLAARHQVIFYDMRNRGRSGRVMDGDRLTLEADIRDLEAIRAHFGLDRVALIGYSYLGKMVVRFALDHPGAVSRLVQLGAVPMDPDRTFPPALVEPPLTADPAFARELGELRARRAEGLHETDPAAYCELEWNLARQGLVGNRANAAELTSRCQLPNEWPTRLAFHMEHHFRRSMLHSIVTAAEVASLETPVLTIHGTRDRNAPYGGGREWAASLPGARLLTLEGVGHAIHAETDLVSILETFLSGAWPDGSERVRSAADGQRSQLVAWDLVRDALDHHAPEGLPTARALRIEWRGSLRPRSQARTSEPPFEPSFPVAREATIGPHLRRLELIEEVQWPSYLSRYRSVVTPDDAFDVDLDSGAVSQPFREPPELLAGVLIGLPPLVLTEILRSGPGSLRFDGVVAREGRRLHAVSALHRGQRWDLYLDPEGALAAVGRMVDEPMLGDTYESVRFAGTRELAGLRLPSRVTRHLDGVGLVSELEPASASWEELVPERFSRPSVEATAEPEPAPFSPAASTEALEALAPGVYLAPIPGRPDYRSLIVERDDQLVLVEASLGEEAMHDLLARVAERLPEKPIRWLVATHHHFDHAGGVPTALASGATLVTTPGNVAFFRRAVTAPRTLAGRPTSDRSPEIHAVDGVWSIPGGPPAVEVLRVEPNDHAAEMLAVYLPDSRLLFQGDLVRFPLTPDESFRYQASALVHLIEAHGLAVDRIAGVHGDVGDPTSLRSWVEANERAP